VNSGFRVGIGIGIAIGIEEQKESSWLKNSVILLDAFDTDTDTDGEQWVRVDGGGWRRCNGALLRQGHG
jgi:hypothetical protein